MHNKIEKNGRNGRFIISQAVVIKFLGIKDSSIKLERSVWMFDIKHNEYGKICVKYSTAKSVGNKLGHSFSTEKRRKSYDKLNSCDTYFLLGFDNDFKNLEIVYRCPNKGWFAVREMVVIYKGTLTSKYDEFKVDEIQFNNIFQKLMYDFKDTTVIGIDDIKEWLDNDK